MLIQHVICIIMCLCRARCPL